jgi:hypothetical protein
MTTHKEYFALLQHPHYYQNISNLPYEPTIASSDQKDSESSEEERVKEDDPFEEDDPAESFAASPHLATPSEPELSPEAGHPFADEIEEMIAEEEEESEIRSSGPFYF